MSTLTPPGSPRPAKREITDIGGSGCRDRAYSRESAEFIAPGMVSPSDRDGDVVLADQPGHPEGPLPRGVHHLLAQFADAIARRPRRLPALLLTTRGDDGGATARRILADHRTRLVDDRDRGGNASLVPHACVRDEPAPAEEPHVRLVIDIADQLQDSMPRGSGPLRLPLLRTVRRCSARPASAAICPPGGGRLRDELYADLIVRRPWLGAAHQLASLGGPSPPRRVRAGRADDGPGRVPALGVRGVAGAEPVVPLGRRAAGHAGRAVPAGRDGDHPGGPAARQRGGSCRRSC